MTDFLRVACNPLRSDVVRLEAYRNYEATAWLEAHVHRGLPFDAIPPEHWDRVRLMLISDQCKVEAPCALT